MTHRNSNRPCRHAFTVGEIVIALAVLAVAATTSAVMMTTLLTERSRLDARIEAVDAAANVLEEARSRGWDDLTPEWAASRPLPPSLARWPDSKLTVRVEPDPNHPRVKRVTAEVRWERTGLEPWPVVSQTTLVAARSTGVKP